MILQDTPFRVSGKSVSVRMRVSAQLGTILVGL